MRCQTRPRSRAHGRTSARESPRPRRQASSCTRKSVTSGQENMGLAPRSRRSLSGSPRRDVPGSRFPCRERVPRRSAFGPRPSATSRVGREPRRGRRRQRVRAPCWRACARKVGARPHLARCRARRTRVQDERPRRIARQPHGRLCGPRARGHGLPQRRRLPRRGLAGSTPRAGTHAKERRVPQGLGILTAVAPVHPVHPVRSSPSRGRRPVCSRLPVTARGDGTT